MDKNAILNTYINSVYAKMDNLREEFPKAMSADIIQMEKGFRYCAQESSKFIEELLTVIESAEVEYEPTQPVQKAIVENTQHTNTLVTPNSILEPKPKNKFMNVLAGGSKDMMGDLFNMIQGKKEEK